MNINKRNRFHFTSSLSSCFDSFELYMKEILFFLNQRPLFCYIPDVLKMNKFCKDFLDLQINIRKEKVAIFSDSIEQMFDYELSNSEHIEKCFINSFVGLKYTSYDLIIYYQPLSHDSMVNKFNVYIDSVTAKYILSIGSSPFLFLNYFFKFQESSENLPFLPYTPIISTDIFISLNHKLIEVCEIINYENIKKEDINEDLIVQCDDQSQIVLIKYLCKNEILSYCLLESEMKGFVMKQYYECERIIALKKLLFIYKKKKITIFVKNKIFIWFLKRIIENMNDNQDYNLLIVSCNSYNDEVYKSDVCFWFDYHPFYFKSNSFIFLDSKRKNQIQKFLMAEEIIEKKIHVWILDVLMKKYIENIDDKDVGSKQNENQNNQDHRNIQDNDVGSQHSETQNNQDHRNIQNNDVGLQHSEAQNNQDHRNIQDNDVESKQNKTQNKQKHHNIRENDVGFKQNKTQNNQKHHNIRENDVGFKQNETQNNQDHRNIRDNDIGFKHNNNDNNNGENSTKEVNEIYGDIHKTLNILNKKTEFDVRDKSVEKSAKYGNNTNDNRHIYLNNTNKETENYRDQGNNKDKKYLKDIHGVIEVFNEHFSNSNQRIESNTGGIGLTKEHNNTNVQNHTYFYNTNKKTESNSGGILEDFHDAKIERNKINSDKDQGISNIAAISNLKFEEDVILSKAMNQLSAAYDSNVCNNNAKLCNSNVYLKEGEYNQAKIINCKKFNAIVEHVETLNNNSLNYIPNNNIDDTKIILKNKFTYYDSRIPTCDTNIAKQQNNLDLKKNELFGQGGANEGIVNNKDIQMSKKSANFRESYEPIPLIKNFNQQNEIYKRPKLMTEDITPNNDMYSRLKTNYMDHENNSKRIVIANQPTYRANDKGCYVFDKELNSSRNKLNNRLYRSSIHVDKVTSDVFDKELNSSRNKLNNRIDRSNIHVDNTAWDVEDKELNSLRNKLNNRINRSNIHVDKVASDVEDKSLFKSKSHNDSYKRAWNVEDKSLLKSKSHNDSHKRAWDVEDKSLFKSKSHNDSYKRASDVEDKSLLKSKSHNDSYKRDIKIDALEEADRNTQKVMDNEIFIRKDKSRNKNIPKMKSFRLLIESDIGQKIKDILGEEKLRLFFYENICDVQVVTTENLYFTIFLSKLFQVPVVYPIIEKESYSFFNFKKITFGHINHYDSFIPSKTIEGTGFFFFLNASISLSIFSKNLNLRIDIDNLSFNNTSFFDINRKKTYFYLSLKNYPKLYILKKFNKDCYDKIHSEINYKRLYAIDELDWSRISHNELKQICDIFFDIKIVLDMNTLHGIKDQKNVICKDFIKFINTLISKNVNQNRKYENNINPLNHTEDNKNIDLTSINNNENSLKRMSFEESDNYNKITNKQTNKYNDPLRNKNLFADYIGNDQKNIIHTKNNHTRKNYTRNTSLFNAHSNNKDEFSVHLRNNHKRNENLYNAHSNNKGEGNVQLSNNHTRNNPTRNGGLYDTHKNKNNESNNHTRNNPTRNGGLYDTHTNKNNKSNNYTTNNHARNGSLYDTYTSKNNESNNYTRNGGLNDTHTNKNSESNSQITNSDYNDNTAPVKLSSIKNKGHQNAKAPFLEYCFEYFQKINKVSHKIESIISRFQKLGISMVHSSLIENKKTGFTKEFIMEYLTNKVDFNRLYYINVIFSRKERFLHNKINNLKYIDMFLTTEITSFITHLDTNLINRFIAVEKIFDSYVGNNTEDNWKFKGVKTLIITPLAVSFSYPSHNVSNRVIRNFEQDMFLRVSFKDEDGKLLKKGDKKDNQSVYDNIKRIMVEGILIGKRKYFFLAMSSSQLKLHSAWFVVPYKHENVLYGTDDIRKWLGNFEKIKNIGKYAVRLGQALSNTVATYNIQNIIDINDIERNGFCFSDGIGKIPLKLVYDISKLLSLKEIPVAFQIRIGGYKGVVSLYDKDIDLLNHIIAFYEFQKSLTEKETCEFNEKQNLKKFFETIKNEQKENYCYIKDTKSIENNGNLTNNTEKSIENERIPYIDPNSHNSIKKNNMSPIRDNNEKCLIDIENKTKSSRMTYEKIEGFFKKAHYELFLRQSMKKFDSSHKNLEIITWSQYSAAYLNRQIIIILESLGISEHIFFKLQDRHLENFITKDKSQLLRKYVPMFDFVDFKANDFAINLINFISTRTFDDIVNKARIFICKGRILMGILDEYNVLEENEIFIQISPCGIDCFLDECTNKSIKVIEGDAIVAKNPCLHPGDIRKVKCVYRRELSYIKDVVVFSSKGSRPIFNMCSGSDLDGDQYFCTWDKNLIPKRFEEADDYSQHNFLHKEMVRPIDIINFYIKFMKDNQLGFIANAHLALSDKLPKGTLEPECKRLAKIFSLGVDYSKTGFIPRLPDDLTPTSFPDFMQMKFNSYKSHKILGKLYRRALHLERLNSFGCICSNKTDFVISTLNTFKCYKLKEMYGKINTEEFLQKLQNAGYKTELFALENDIKLWNKVCEYDYESKSIYNRYKSQVYLLLQKYKASNECELFTGLVQNEEFDKNGTKDINMLFKTYKRILREKVPQNDLIYKSLSFLKATMYSCKEEILSFSWLGGIYFKLNQNDYKRFIGLIEFLKNFEYQIKNIKKSRLKNERSNVSHKIATTKEFKGINPSSNDILHNNLTHANIENTQSVQNFNNLQFSRVFGEIISDEPLKLQPNINEYEKKALATGASTGKSLNGPGNENFLVFCLNENILFINPLYSQTINDTETSYILKKDKIHELKTFNLYKKIAGNIINTYESKELFLILLGFSFFELNNFKFILFFILFLQEIQKREQSNLLKYSLISQNDSNILNDNQRQKLQMISALIKLSKCSFFDSDFSAEKSLGIYIINELKMKGKKNFEEKCNMLLACSYLLSNHMRTQLKILQAINLTKELEQRDKYLAMKDKTMKYVFKPFLLIIIGMLDCHDTVYMTTYTGIYNHGQRSFRRYIPVLNNLGFASINNYIDEVRMFILNHIGCAMAKSKPLNIKVKIFSGKLYFYNLSNRYINNNVEIEEVEQNISFNTVNTNNTRESNKISAFFLNRYFFDKELSKNKKNNELNNIKETRCTWYLKFNYKNTKYKITYEEEDGFLYVLNIKKDIKNLGKSLILKPESDIMMQIISEKIIFCVENKINKLKHDEEFMRNDIFEIYCQSKPIQMNFVHKSDKMTDIMIEIITKEYLNDEDKIKFKADYINNRMIYMSENNQCKIAYYNNEVSLETTITKLFESVTFREFDDFYKNIWKKIDQ